MCPWCAAAEVSSYETPASTGISARSPKAQVVTLVPVMAWPRASRQTDGPLLSHQIRGTTPSLARDGCLNPAEYWAKRGPDCTLDPARRGLQPHCRQSGGVRLVMQQGALAD